MFVKESDDLFVNTESLIEHTPAFAGERYLFRFENGYGASVIRHQYSLGHEKDLWELGVVKFQKNGDWKLNYKTPITDDVLGCLTVDDVKSCLEKIEKLEKK